MNFLLDIDKSQYGDKIIKTAGFSETVAFGAKILLIGMLTIFAVLCLIWLCLSIFKAVFARSGEKKSVKAAKVEASEVVASAPLAVSDDNEIIAVIAAAIAAAESECANGAKFKVVSFRRK